MKKLYPKSKVLKVLKDKVLPNLILEERRAFKRVSLISAAYKSTYYSSPWLLQLFMVDPVEFDQYGIDAVAIKYNNQFYRIEKILESATNARQNELVSLDVDVAAYYGIDKWN